jgi:alcohol dehydrogenase class IV
MGINFEFATASKIIFGNNSFGKVPEVILSTGNNVFLVTGKNSKRAELLADKIKQKKGNVIIYSVETEPTTSLIEDAVNIARAEGCNTIAGLGGGSVIDSAKAIAAMVPNKGWLLDYLEVIGLGKPLVETPLPCIAIPTTAGTGAEVTKNSVIKSVEHKVKVSLRSDKMYPSVAVVDPVLTYSMLPALTASTGMDALTHLLETFVSNQSNPFIDMICREGMQRISSSLLNAFKNSNDAVARENMAMAGMFGGIALANVKLGAVHGFAGPMGGMYPIPHGEVCASLLPAVLEVNIATIKKHKHFGLLDKFEEIARIFSGNYKANADNGVECITKLVSELNIPRLATFGLTTDDFPELVLNAKNSSSMKGNPVVLSEDELYSILGKSL